jgi:hypothetical protein
VLPFSWPAVAAAEKAPAHFALLDGGAGDGVCVANGPGTVEFAAVSGFGEKSFGIHRPL